MIFDIGERYKVTSKFGNLINIVFILVGIFFIGGSILTSLLSFLGNGVQKEYRIFAIIIFSIFIFLFYFLIKLLMDTNDIIVQKEGLELKKKLIPFKNIKNIKIYYGLYKVVVVKYSFLYKTNRAIGVLPIFSNKKYRESKNIIERVKREI